MVRWLLQMACARSQSGQIRADRPAFPAAFCGLVGFKPSKKRVPTDGAFPLSFTLDSVGPIARSVAACAAADAVLAGDDPWTVRPEPLRGLRLGIPQGLPLKDLDPIVANRFSDATKELAKAGVQLSDETIPLIDDVVRLNAKATFSAVESYFIHRDRLATRAADYDPFVLARIEGGSKITAADYLTMLHDRAALVRAMDARLSDLDAVVLPTTPIVAPTIAEVSTSKASIRRTYSPFVIPPL